jgi:hypothetical protein
MFSGPEQVSHLVCQFFYQFFVSFVPATMVDKNKGVGFPE